jgi:cytidyltransferase-like protein
MIVDIHDTKQMWLLSYYCKSQSMNSEIIGFMSGAWDLFHHLHVLTLKRAKRLCDFLIVGIGTDRLVRADKGDERPIYPEEHRIGIIDSIKYVDACFLMDSEEEYGQFVRSLQYHGSSKINLVMFKNQDWVNRLDAIPGFINDMKDLDAICRIYEERKIDIGKQLHGNVMILPDTGPISKTSTTQFIERIKKLNGPEVKDPYRLSDLSGKT